MGSTPPGARGSSLWHNTHGERTISPPPTSPPPKPASLAEILQLPDRMQRKGGGYAAVKYTLEEIEAAAIECIVRLREDLEAARRSSDAFETAVHELAVDVDAARADAEKHEKRAAAGAEAIRACAAEAETAMELVSIT